MHSAAYSSLPVIHYPFQIEVNNMMIRCQDTLQEPADWARPFPRPSCSRLQSRRCDPVGRAWHST